jgi:RNA polymerase sigma-70 factor (ECF subfamily)
MPPDDSFQQIMEQLRAGDAASAAEVLRRFTGRLIALARGRLDTRLRQKVDPEDVLQSVYKSFFLRQARGEFELHDWDGLWALLVVITLRKCGRWAAHFRTAGRDVTAEVAVGPASGDSGDDWDVAADEPTPSEAAMLTETVEALLRDLPDRDRAILTLALQGYNAREISAQLNRPERTVYRVLHRVKKRLECLPPDGNEGNEEPRPTRPPG